MARAEMTVHLKDLPEFKEIVARAATAEAKLEQLRGEHTRGSGDHSSFCAGCDRIWPCPSIWIIDQPEADDA